MIEFDERNLGDFSIAKDIDKPLYNFAAAIDDYEMKISHVIRGEDHISNTPKQILIQEALGLPQPPYAHLPLILGPDRSKLSKRYGATSIREYKKDYLPDALMNFMAFLGFTYSKEILDKKEMAEEFDLRKIHKGGAVFNIEKLNWINSQYLRKLGPREFREVALASGQAGVGLLPDRAVPLVTERLERLSDVAQFDYFLREPEYEAGLLIWRQTDPHIIKEQLLAVRNALSSKVEWTVFDKAYIRSELDAISPQDRGVVYWPLRVALTGKEKSPDPVDVMEVLGREKTLQRIDEAIRKLEV
jgi:glutamyl/glutaminyl-tRNA synthetase